MERQRSKQVGSHVSTHYPNPICLPTRPIITSPHTAYFTLPASPPHLPYHPFIPNFLRHLGDPNRAFPGSEATNRTLCRGEVLRREG